MGLFMDSSTKNEVLVAVFALGILGGGIHGLQKGVSCSLKEVSVEKPGNETVLFENTGTLDLGLELRRSSYDNGVFDFVGGNEQHVTVQSGESAEVSLTDGKIMQYRLEGCRANSGLVRYGEIDPYDGGPDVSDTIERYN